jgi:hypothetical protein
LYKDGDIMCFDFDLTNAELAVSAVADWPAHL